MTRTALRRRLAAAGFAACLCALALGPGSASATFPGGNGPIVFSSNRDGNSEIYRMNPDGTGQTRLTNNSAADNDPVWTQDRTKIAFVSTRDGNAEIYTMDANGANPVRITTNAAADTEPAWTPNGGAIVFSSDRDGDREIYKVTSDGSVTTKLTNNAVADFAPDVSTDGSKIVFQRFTGGVGTGAGDEIYVMNADGSSQVNLTSNASSISDIDPSWRPDGTEIAFASNRFGGNYEIFRMAANGTNPTQLTNNAGSDIEPAYSPDGLLIAFTSNRTGNNEVFRMTRTGASPTNISNNSASDSEPAWQALDIFPPETTIDSGPADGAQITDSTPTFEFSTDEAGSTFQCSIDAAPFSACSSPYTTPVLADGPHTFAVRAVDPSGNPDPTPASRSFAVDATLPETTITSGPADGSTINEDTATFEFDSTEPGTFECSLDGEAFAACASPYTTPTLTQGPHTFEVRAIDTFGNVDQTPDMRTFTVDLGNPETTIDSGPADGGLTNDSTPTFTFSSSELNSTFECNVDGAGFTACTSPFTTDPLTDGEHTFAVRAIDAGGNIDDTPASRTFTVDTVPSDTAIIAGPAEGSTTEQRRETFLVTSPDSSATFECSVDGGAFTPCDPLYVTPELDDGTHTIEIRSVDAAGNPDPSPATRTYTVEAPPRTTITSGPADGSTTPDFNPTFTFVSDENDSVFECSVDGSVYQSCTSPFTTPDLGDGEHTFVVRAIDPQSRPDPTPETRVFTVDTTSPDTTIDSGPADGSTTTDDTPTFTFSSSDQTATFECSVDGAGFTPCSSPYTTGSLSDGSHTFEVRAIDPSGNYDDTPASRTFTVDTTAPETSIDSGPADGSFTNDTTPTFTFSSPDNTATFECSVDGGAFSPCTSPFTTPALSNGSHTFSVRAVDPQGTTDQTPASRTFTVDTIAPQTTILTGPAPGGQTSDASPTFTFSSSQVDSTFECSLDGAAFTACTSPHTTSTLADGSHTFAVRATDPAGNTDATPAQRTFTVDTADPDTTITGGPAEGSTTDDDTPTFTFTSTDAGSTFQCSVDGGAYAPCTSPFTTPSLPDGPHSFAVYATDPAGNVDSTPATRSFSVDVVPDTTITSGPAEGSTSGDSTPTFEFTSSENDSTFECSVDGGAFTPCTSPHTTTPLSEGQHTFAVRAVDPQSRPDATPATRTFTIDLTGAETTIDSGPADGSTTPDNTPTFTFSSPEQDATFECSLDGAGFTPCASPQTPGPLSDGSHTFAVRAVDIYGNPDATPASRTFSVDTTPTDTSIDSGPADGSSINDTTPTFTFSSPEQDATFECSVDGGGFGTCTSPDTIGPLADGPHTFAVRAVDAFGNIDQTPASRTFTVDTANPETSITSGPADGSTGNDNTPTFQFDSSDAGSSFECSVDGTAFTACTSPHTTSTLADGPHTFAVRATDPAGNTDATPATRSFTIDTAAPDTTITGGPAEGSTIDDDTPTFQFSSPDGTATFQCSVDGGAYAPCTSPFTTPSLPDGAHTFAVRAVDPSGNIDPTPASRSFTVDVVPDTTITSGPADGSTTDDNTPTFEFASSENDSFLQCSVDNASFTACTSPKTMGPLADGQHTFRVRAVDQQLRPDATPATRTFTVDTSVPFAAPQGFSARMSDGGTVPVVLSCTGDKACSGTLTLQTTKKSKKVRLGRSTYRIAAGATKHVRVRLTRGARHLVKSRNKVHAIAIAQGRGYRKTRKLEVSDEPS